MTAVFSFRTCCCITRTGYDEKPDGRFMVKAVTYGGYEWLDFAKLWNTGYKRKGGLILFKET